MIFLTSLLFDQVYVIRQRSFFILYRYFFFDRSGKPYAVFGSFSPVGILTVRIPSGRSIHLAVYIRNDHMGFSCSLAGDLKWYIFQTLQSAVCDFDKIQVSAFYLVFNCAFAAVQGNDFAVFPYLKGFRLCSIRQISIRCLDFFSLVCTVGQPVFGRCPKTILLCFYCCDRFSRLVHLSLHQNCLCRTVYNRKLCSS